MTSLFTPLLQSVRISATKPLPLRIAVQTVFLFLMLYAEWLIPVPPFSLSGCCKHTKSALHWTPVSSSVIVHPYDLPQLCWITLLIWCQSSHFCFNCGRRRTLGLGHHDASCLPHCLLSLHIGHVLFFPSPICCRSSPGSMTMHHSVRPRCRVNSIARGSTSCCSSLSALPRPIGGFTLLRAPAAERNTISSAIGALFQRVAAE